MSTAGSPTCPMEILAAVTSHINWAPLLPSPALQGLSWNKAQGQLSALTPAIPTGMTANLCARVSFRTGRQLYFKCVNPWIYQPYASELWNQTLIKIANFLIHCPPLCFYMKWESHWSINISTELYWEASRCFSIKTTALLTVSYADLLAYCENWEQQRDCGRYETGRDIAPGQGLAEHTGVMFSTKR